MVIWSQVTNKKRYISTSTRPITAKLYKVGVHSKGPLSIKSFWRFDDWSHYHVTDEKRYISTSARLWLPNLTKWWVLMQAYYLPSHTTCWSRGHIRSHENEKCFKFIFTWPVAIKLDKHVQPQCHIFLWSRGYVSSRDKWTSLYLYFHKAYCY